MKKKNNKIEMKQTGKAFTYTRAEWSRIKIDSNRNWNSENPNLPRWRTSDKIKVKEREKKEKAV